MEGENGYCQRARAPGSITFKHEGIAVFRDKDTTRVTHYMLCEFVPRSRRGARGVN